MRPSGLEPPRGNLPTRPSTLRVYQFRHERRVREYSPGPSPDEGHRPCGICVRPSGSLDYEHMFVIDRSPSERGVKPPWI